MEDKIKNLMSQGYSRRQATMMCKVMKQQGGGMQQEQDQMQQIMQQVAQALQSGADPQEIMQQLVQMGVPQEQAQQLIQGVMQQMQGQVPQDEAESQQMMQPEQQQEMAQQGMVNGYSDIQKPIKDIRYNVSTTGMREGSLPDTQRYTRVEYKDGTYDYIKPQAEIENDFKRMPNYIRYMRSKQPIKPVPIVAQMQQAGYAQQPQGFFDNENNTYDNPYFGQQPNTYNNPQFVQQPNTQNVPYPSFFHRYPPPQPSLGDESAMYMRRDNNGDGFIDEKDQTDKFGNPVNSEVKKQPQSYAEYSGTNPFGQVTMENAAYNLGRSLKGKGAWNNVMGIASAGKLLVGGLREGFSGYANEKENQRINDEYQTKLYRDNRPITYGQQGSKITNAEAMTGRFITDNPQGNLNTEHGEHLMSAEGNVQKIIGEPHVKNGKEAEGVDIEAQEGDRILSNVKFMNIGVKNAKELKEKYELAIKSKDTFSAVLDKFNNKIGIKSLTEEQAELIEKLAKNEKVKSKETKMLNEEVLTAKIKETSDRLETLNEVSAVVFDDLFKRQELIPKKGNGELLDTDGTPLKNSDTNVAQQGGDYISDLAKQYGISPERANELIAQQGGMQSPQEEQDQMQQIMQQVAQALQSGVDPQEIMQQLVQMGVPQEQAQQLIQGVMQQMQAPQEQHQMPDGSMMDGASHEQEQPMMAQQGKVYAQQPQGLGGATQINDYLSQWSSEPNHTYKEVKKTAERFKPFFDKYGIKYTDSELGSQAGLDKLAGQLQSTLIKNYPEVADDYGNRIEPTRKGLQYLVDNKIIDAKELGINLDNGKVRVGSYGTLSSEVQKKIQKKVQELDVDKKKSYSTQNYKDDQAYFRTLDVKDIPFSDKAEYDKYLLDNEKNKIGGAYRTDKVGAYIKPVFTPITPEAKADVETPNDEKKSTIVDNGVRGNVNYDGMGYQPYIMPPTPMDSIYKPEVRFQRIEPVKQTTEPYLANQAVAMDTQRESLIQSGLDPQTQQALMGTANATDMMASNDAISKVENFNANNQFQVDQFNIGQGTKEQLTNEQANMVYQDQVMGSRVANESQWRDYYNTLNNVAYQNQNDRINRNLVNAQNPTQKVDANGNIYFVAPRYSVTNGSAGIDPKKWEDMTAEERKVETLRRTKEMNDSGYISANQLEDDGFKTAWLNREKANKAFKNATKKAGQQGMDYNSILKKKQNYLAK